MSEAKEGATTMSFMFWPAFLLMISLAAGPCASAEQGASGATASTNSSAAAKTAASQEAGVDKSPVKSGVYGFSGARSGDRDPKGVIGECIWIFDRSNKAQLAKGDCLESDPGKFRVPLKPGKYVVRGPGGNRPVVVKDGQWVKVVSIVPLPVGF
jgi:hypothetical protein